MYNIFSFEAGKFELNAPGSTRRYLAVLLLFSALLYLGNLAQPEFTGSDEVRVGAIGAEFVLDHQWVAPRLNGEPFLEMPPLFYWAEALSFKLFGIDNLAARLPSALAAIWAVVVCFLFAGKLGFKPFTAFCAALVLAVAPQFWGSGRSATVDMLLASLTLTAVFGYYCSAVASPWRQKIGWMLVFALATGGAIMTKGMIGLAIPGAAVGSWLCCDNLIRRRPTWGNWLLMFSGVMLALLPLALWIYYLNRELGWEHGGKVVLITNNFDRFAGNHQDHRESWFYYLRKLGEIFQPWQVFVWAGVFWFGRKFYRDRNRAALMLLCYLLFPLLLLNIASVKRMVYLLPTNPAMALLAGGFIGLLLQGEITWKNRVLAPGRVLYWLGFGLGAVAAVAATVVMVLPRFLTLRTPELQPLGFCALLLAILLMWLLRQRQFGRAATTVLLLFPVAFLLINTLRAERVRSRGIFRTAFTRIAADLADGKELLLINPMERTRGCAVYFLHRRVTVCTPEEALELQAGNPGRYLLLLNAEEDFRSRFRIIRTYQCRKDRFTLAEIWEKKL
ncbi:MAG: phospholipid carrier-dependent glycosyltransferase, partial [Victivallales bacterium]|nr:phospholipid carrier-dependent glycosyltransferase [Victivallales bacterium]